MDDSNAIPFKDAIYKQFARIGKCLSSEKRLELLDLMSQGAKSVEKLARQTGMSTANVSRHLQILAEARLVSSRKKGTFVYYELANPAVNELLLALWKAGERQLTDIRRIKDQLWHTQDRLYPMPLAEALEKQRQGDIVLIDVRPAEEYEYGHIAGAISVPMHALAERMQQWSGELEIVAYCRGPYCAYAAHAVKELRTHGFAAYHLEEGVNEWKQYTGNME